MDERNSRAPFYKVSAWSFPVQLLALLLVLTTLGMIIGRVLPEPDIDPGFSAGTPLPDPQVLSQLADLQREEPIGNTELEFREFNRTSTNHDLAVSGKGVLLANFDGDHDVDRVRFELWEGPRIAALRLDEHRSYAADHPELYEMLNPPFGSWANFCLNSEIFGLECFARVENAVIRGRIQDDVSWTDLNVEKIDAGILVNVGVKHWMRIFGDTKDTS